MTLLLSFVIGFALPGAAQAAARGAKNTAFWFSLVATVAIVLLATSA